MKIGKPVKKVPPSTHGRAAKYAAVWKAVAALPNGDWLPVECKDYRAADRVCIAASTHRTLKLKAKRRGNVAYIQTVQA